MNTTVQHLQPSIHLFLNKTFFLFYTSNHVINTIFYISVPHHSLVEYSSMAENGMIVISTNKGKFLAKTPEQKKTQVLVVSLQLLQLIMKKELLKLGNARYVPAA